MNAIDTRPDTQIKRTCMRDHIRDTLVARILDGHYAAGTQLKELALAREFNVSQAPIREALRELEGSGLVMSERFRGTRVRGIDLEDLRESYELRTTMEVRALELAIPMSAATLAQLAQYLNAMQTAIDEKNLERYIDAALALHRGVITASGNRLFGTVWDSLHFDIRGRIVMRKMAERGNSFGALLHIHAKLIDYLRAGDTAQAIQIPWQLYNHLFRSLAALPGA